MPAGTSGHRFSWRNILPTRRVRAQDSRVRCQCAIRSFAVPPVASARPRGLCAAWRIVKQLLRHVFGWKVIHWELPTDLGPCKIDRRRALPTNIPSSPPSQSGACHQVMLSPPSTVITCPVIQFATSDASNTIQAATSSGSPLRSSGMRLRS